MRCALWATHPSRSTSVRIVWSESRISPSANRCSSSQRSARCWLQPAGGSTSATEPPSPSKGLCVNADVNKLEAIARRFDALQAETKRLQEAAAPLILAANERSAWAEILEELGSSCRRASSGSPISSPCLKEGPIHPLRAPHPGRPCPSRARHPGRRNDPVRPPPDRRARRSMPWKSAGFISRIPNEKEARVIDEFVDQLQKSEVFKIEEKDKAKAVIQRTTPDGQSWAYGYTIVLPLRNPITLP